MPLSPGRPVTVGDLAALPSILGLSIETLTWALGISNQKWGKIARDGRHPDLCRRLYHDPRPSLMARWLVSHPNPAVPLKAPSADEIYSRISQITTRRPPLKAFSVLLGAKEATGFQWLREQYGQAATYQRVFALLTCDSDQEFAERWRTWVRLAVREGHLRGISDPGRESLWLPRLALAPALPTPPPSNTNHQTARYLRALLDTPGDRP